MFVFLVDETRSGLFSSVEDAAATSGGEQVGAERRALFWRENATSSGVRPSRSRASREKTRFFSWFFFTWSAWFRENENPQAWMTCAAARSPDHHRGFKLGLTFDPQR